MRVQSPLPFFARSPYVHGACYLLLHPDNVGRTSLKQLSEFFSARELPVPEDLMKALENDRRAGARRLAGALRVAAAKNCMESMRLENLLRFENDLCAQGFRCIAGIDEAGMAPLAGPVIAAAIILPERYKLSGLNDSKKIPDPRRRADLAARLKQDAVSWSTGKVESDEIDRFNIYRAGLLAMKRALEALTVTPDYVLVDARTLPSCAIPQKGIIHGDQFSASIAAASIIAKTTRDAIMMELDRIYPDYGFAEHKGYPTPAHLAVLSRRGPLAVHRRSFRPVRESIEAAQKLLFSKPEP